MRTEIEAVERLVEGYSRAREAIAMTIVGHIEAVDLALTALLCACPAWARLSSRGVWPP
jgi:hypothetical protein